ncbi:MAG: DUF3800 domain-containing protein [Syntrophorhabdales bacterium]|jgi:hypothetical protein
MLSRRDYLEGVWWVLHRSDDPDKKAVVMTCYLDDSGTDNQGPVAVSGGILVNKANFLHFDEKWTFLLDRYKVRDHKDNRRLHMKDFRSTNKHLSRREQRALFLGLSDLINSHKYISVAATLTHDQFKTLVHDEIKEHTGMHFFCFLLCAFHVHGQAEYMKFNERIAFLLEHQEEHEEEILRAHGQWIRRQEQQELHMGTLGFSDEKFSALQAADVVAWGVRRQLSGLPFPFEFEPILDILRVDHLQDQWKDDALTTILKWTEDEVEKEKDRLNTATLRIS